MHDGERLNDDGKKVIGIVMKDQLKTWKSKKEID